MELRAQWGELDHLAVDVAFHEKVADATNPLQDQRLKFVHIKSSTDGVLEARVSIRRARASFAPAGMGVSRVVVELSGVASFVRRLGACSANAAIDPENAALDLENTGMDSANAGVDSESAGVASTNAAVDYANAGVDCPIAGIDSADAGVD